MYYELGLHRICHVNVSFRTTAVCGGDAVRDLSRLLVLEHVASQL